MQTRRDHIQAYRFSAGRLVHAATAGDPGIGEQPFRRGNLGLVMGLMAAVLLSGGAAVYGLISPAPDKSWKAQGSIIVEKETGTRYILMNGQLRPTANYASARLAAGAKPTVHIEPRSTLAALPVGPSIGIAGAPDSLPDPSALLDGTWSLCLGATGSGGSTVLDLAPAQHAAAVPAGRPIVVTASSSEYVLWNSRKYPVPNASVLAVLGLGNQAPLPVPTTWLGVIGDGDALSPAQIPSAGAPGPRIAGQKTKVGEVFQTTAGGVAQFYVLRGDGLAPITRTEAALLATVPGNGQPLAVGPSDIAGTPASADQSLLRRLPDMLATTSYAPPAGARLCAYQAAATSSAGTGTATGVGPVLVTEAGQFFPDKTPVLIPPGKALIADSTSTSPLTRAPAAYLITDAGMRFAVDGTDTLNALGYPGVAGHVFPDAVLGSMPAGPTLSVSAAQKAVSWPAG
ncbi:type VII secretion protein EccB [Catenulispora rubra]|uniref:type VII secretion protein EccB n=1 Tax=Catenulispora rubra TaxID=280293 RepID=UPI0018922168|nr:type VII secretion protein EccB [Catenulispora rubra]